VLNREGDVEVKVRATAEAETDDAVCQRYADAVATEIGWQPVVGQFALFRIDIDDVTVVAYDSETGEQHVVQWPAGIEYVRPATTPTSLGERQPVNRLLA
jgi:hypothetical protein